MRRVKTEEGKQKLYDHYFSETRSQHRNYNKQNFILESNNQSLELVFQYQEQINWEVETQATVMDKKDIIREIQQEAEHLDFQIQKLVEEVENDYKLPIAFIGGSLQKMKEELEKRKSHEKVIKQSSLMLIQGVVTFQSQYQKFMNHKDIKEVFIRLVEAPNRLASLHRKYIEKTTLFEIKFEKIISQNQTLRSDKFDI